MTSVGESVDERADRLIEREVLACQSGLVDELLKQETLGFDYGSIVGLYPDPTDWGEGDCEDWLGERAIEYPSSEEDDDRLDELRDLVRDNAEPEEIYEWWLVTQWMADKLRDVLPGR